MIAYEQENWPAMVVDYYFTIPDWPSSWRACLETWLEALYARSSSDCTIASYVTTLARFFADGHAPWTSTPTTVLAFLHQRRPVVGQGAPKAGTMNQRQAIISSFYKFASGYWIDEQTPLYTGANPAQGIRRALPVQVYRQYSPDELRRFFAAIDVNKPAGRRNRALFLAYFHTCRRKSELARLLWRDIEPAVFDGRAGWQYHFRGKGRPIDDIAELPELVYQELLRYSSSCGLERRPEDPVFVAMEQGRSGSGGPIYPLRAIKGDTIWLALKKICAAAGLPPDKTVHGLRHSSARQRAEAGEPLLALSRTLRHQNVGTTSLYLQGLQSTADKGSALLAARFADL